MIDAITPSARNERLARALRGFGPVGVIVALIIVFGSAYFIPIGAPLVLLWARLSHTPWCELGLVRPRSWMVIVLGGIAFGIVLKLIMKAIVMPLLGADPVNQAHQHLAGNTAALPLMILMIIVCNGFGEEAVFRGFLFERLGKLFGSSKWAKVGIVLLTSALFGIGHYFEQGLAGAQQATIGALLFGSIFAITGRLWLLIIAHAAFDLTALALIYWGLEARVASFVFN